MANLYQLTNYGVNHAEPIPVTGMGLAHLHLDLIGRAFLAAELHRGEKHLVAPTITQSAKLAGVNTTYAWWANKRFTERILIEGGVVPLVPPVTVKPVIFTDDTIPDAVLADVIRSAGIMRTLDVAAQMRVAAE
jgi:hypothetical protein